MCCLACHTTSGSSVGVREAAARFSSSAGTTSGRDTQKRHIIAGRMTAEVGSSRGFGEEARLSGHGVDLLLQ